MAETISMPKLGFDMAEGLLVRWVKQVGENINKGDVLAEIVSRIYEEAFDYVDAPIIRVAQKEVPLPYNRTLEQAALPQVPDIVAAAKEVLK